MTQYHYTECGLDNVYIDGIDLVEDDAGEKVFSVPFIGGLHKAIALGIVNHDRGMSAKELRFLRTEMGITQAELASRIHREPLAVGRWERGEVPIDSLAEAIIRLMAIERLELISELSVEETTARCVPTAEPQTITIDGSNPKQYLVAA